MDYGLISFFMFILVASIHSLPGIIKIGKENKEKYFPFFDVPFRRSFRYQ